MKKRTSLVLALALAMVGSLAGCSGRVVYDGSAAKNIEKVEETTDVDVVEDGLKTGLALMPKVESSADAGETDGLAQTDVSIAAVTVNAEGKIVACAIDAVQVKINFDKEGKLVTALDSQFKTKQELGADYGMKAASSIQKEWNEQADAFAAYCVGKTADEITAIAAGEDGKPADVDLAAGCSVTHICTRYSERSGDGRRTGDDIDTQQKATAKLSACYLCASARHDDHLCRTNLRILYGFATVTTKPHFLRSSRCLHRRDG